jgi:two-component system, cell cycle response regulator
VTISIGIASLAGPEDTAASVLKRADQALYRAKRDGRNRVVLDAA